MTSAVSALLRRLVAERARYRCEYCGLPQSATLYKHEPDHIIPLQHGGKTTEDNLALACLRCNRNKAPNIASYDPATGLLTPLFDPRRQRWEDHFEFVDAEIVPHTAEARVAVRILRLNDPERVMERRALQEAGNY